jgi:hypothetical protein
MSCRLRLTALFNATGPHSPTHLIPECEQVAGFVHNRCPLAHVMLGSSASRHYGGNLVHFETQPFP